MDQVADGARLGAGGSFGQATEGLKYLSHVKLQWFTATKGFDVCIDEGKCTGLYLRCRLGILFGIALLVQDRLRTLRTGSIAENGPVLRGKQKLQDRQAAENRAALARLTIIQKPSGDRS